MPKTEFAVTLSVDEWSVVEHALINLINSTEFGGVKQVASTAYEKIGDVLDA